MMPPKLILAPVDFSDSSHQALDVAAGMAAGLGATLLVVHIVPAIPDLPRGVSVFKDAQYDQELHEEAFKRLSELADNLKNKGLNVRTEVGTANDVAMELVRIAAQNGVDMLVISTHGMTGWRPIAFGSVAKKVVEEAPCPVLVLRAKAGENATEPRARRGAAANP
jgi:nucleotide-binding universal stress UspA family protein